MLGSSEADALLAMLAAVLFAFSQMMEEANTGYCLKLVQISITQLTLAEKAMAPHSSTFAWRIPGTGEPGGLLSLGSHRVGHDCSDLAAAAPHQYFSQV